MIFVVFVFLLGLIIGSFLNVVIYRLPEGKSVVWPGSFCPECGIRLKALDLIPVLSYVFLKGRCRYCNSQISPVYPAVELLTGFLFVLVYMKYGLTLQTLTGIVLTSLLIPAAIIDIKKGIIPNKITYPGVVAGLALSFTGIGVKNSLAGAASLAAVYLLAAVLSRGGMGGGDVKLAAVIGAFTGLKGALATFILSSLAGGIWALFLLATGKGGRKTEVRFGPFLAVSAWISFMFADEILFYYLGGWRCF
ncbi:A24 family peptidase [Thermosyntropha sp.]|uniref:prepilin peptidase n=1 Tax=Thermosyntropha sp. TaxID=2740820 RepID=UPI0025E638FA|nr:A24 family peptidase [Thermosyntropha sp.]MBO8159238.1 prepilin peptidase [Thermosyntropha sp.]